MLVLLGMNFSTQLTAELTVGGGRGGGSCSMVVDQITRRWSDVKQAMLPIKAKLRRVKREDFYCVSPQYVRNAIEKRAGFGSGLKCFSDPEGMGLGMCCDEALQECARLRPDLVPEEARRKKKEPRYQKSNSDWVRPPSDDDQW